MKRTIFIVFLCFLMMASSLVSFGENIDTEKNSSLTLYYLYGGEPFEGLEIKTYRVANIAQDGQLSLTDIFKNYPVSISGVASQTEWKYIASTLAAYTVADGIAPTKSGMTDSEGRVAFSDILPGMYLTLSVSAKSGERVVIFENFLTVIPRLDENGQYNYDAVAYPKYSSYVPEPQDKEYKVVKQWKDLGYEENRPEYVEVDIFKDGVLQESVRLFTENNWSYSWKAPDDGGEWTAVERNIDEKYTVTVIKDGNTLIVTNVHESEEEPPETGEMTSVWFYVIAFGLSGGVITILAFWRKRYE